MECFKAVFSLNNRLEIHGKMLNTGLQNYPQGTQADRQTERDLDVCVRRRTDGEIWTSPYNLKNTLSRLSAIHNMLGVSFCFVGLGCFFGSAQTVILSVLAAWSLSSSGGSPEPSCISRTLPSAGAKVTEGAN